MWKGHMQKRRKNIQSTKTANTISHDYNMQPVNLNNSSYLYMSPIPCSEFMATDQTGQFPVISSRGYKYLMVVYVKDCNAILAEPLKSRNGTDLLQAYTKIHQYLSHRGFTIR